LLKVREILHAVHQTQQVRAGAEREAGSGQATATAGLEELRARVATDQARLDRLKAAIGETERSVDLF
jgi:hypothetical protein